MAGAGRVVDITGWVSGDFHSRSTLGVVMGPEHAATKPVAVTNPIFVDVKGDGFTPNGDLLGLPIPHQEKPTHRRHVHRHAHPHSHDHD